MSKISNAKRILAGVFIVVISLFALKSNAFAGLETLAGYVAQDAGNAELTMSQIESDYVSTIWEQQSFININGLMAKTLNMQGFYSDMGMYVTNDNYIVSASAETSTDYEYEQIVAFKNYLDSIGVNLLYINAPTKYIDDSLFNEQFGVATYCNQNADLFVERITKAGIPNIDLRNNMEEDGLEITEQFFRTDHHWTTECGLWATQIIAEGLNEYCNYSIDTSIYDTYNYTFTEYENCWLGEQGRKVAATYVGLDDFTCIKPNFDTNYIFTNTGEWVQGTFDDFIKDEIYNLENDVYENKSWYYSYSPRNCFNQNVANGKVLVVADSYFRVIHPFLSLGVHQCDSLILRNYGEDFNLKEFVRNGGYDTVIICYAQFMIGAHDDPTNANYPMFSFN